MGDENYEKIVEKISKSSGLEKEEIERRIEAKRAKLAGLISKEGAAQVIAAELGISFDNEKLKINELLPSMRKVNLVGKIINLSPVRTFTTKKGDEGKVVNLTVADDTSNIKVVLWDTNHIALIEKGDIKDGSVVDIGNGSMRSNELHLGSFSELKPSTEVLDNLVTEKIVKEKSISDFKLADSVSARAFIVQAFDPKFFHVCPECRKKAIQEAEGFSCGEHGKINPDKRALINLVLDDGTETIRSVLFQDALEGLGMGDLEDTDNMIVQRQNLLGKEMVFSGDIRMNNFFNNPEFIVENVKEVNPDEIISILEKE
jgi:ssDNA-binding replication factor A large subunit